MQIDASEPGISVAELVGHVLEVVRIEAIVIPQHLGVRGVEFPWISKYTL